MIIILYFNKDSSFALIIMVIPLIMDYYDKIYITLKTMMFMRLFVAVYGNFLGAVSED